MRIIGTKRPEFLKWQLQNPKAKYNGSYFYALELENIILPQIASDKVVNTVGTTIYEELPRGTVIVAHSSYEVLRVYRDYLGKGYTWVCSFPNLRDDFANAGENTALIPMSVDLSKLEKYRGIEKTKDTAFMGNVWKYKTNYFSENVMGKVDVISGIPREEALRIMASYKKVICEARCAIEAQYLGCEIITPTYDKGFNSFLPQVRDSREVIPLWRAVLKGCAKIKA